MRKLKRFLRVNAGRIAVALCGTVCLVAISCLTFCSARDYEKARAIVQPIIVTPNGNWLSAYRPVTFGDCPTQPPRETTTEETTARETERKHDTVQEKNEIKVTEITGSPANDPYEEEREGKAEYGKSLGYFTCTAYCGCSYCSEGYGNMTATGVYARANHTIAVDPSVIPYGTWVVINGQTYKAEDCGGGINGREIDIYFDSHAATVAFGVRTYEVFLA